MSGSDQLLGVVVTLMCLVLVGSALLSRRLDSQVTVRLALLWVVIIIGVAAAIRLLDSR